MPSKKSYRHRVFITVEQEREGRPWKLSAVDMKDGKELRVGEFSSPEALTSALSLFLEEGTERKEARMEAEADLRKTLKMPSELPIIFRRDE